MTRNRWTVVALLLGIAGAPAGAQQMGGMHPAGGQGRMMDQGMMQMCGGMMGGDMMSGGGMAGHGMMGGMAAGQGMMGGTGAMGMMPAGGASPAALLRAGDELALTPDQKTRLEALANEPGEGRQTHMQAAMAARTRATKALSADAPDLQAYQNALEEAASRMVEVHVAVARAALDARAVLTPEQRSKIGEGMRLMGSMMCGGMGGS